MQKTRILYIEDEESLGRIVQGTLEHQGFEVFWKSDGADVLNALADFKPDICVVDIMLPNIDGYNVCKSIKGRFPSLPVIFVTAKTSTRDLVEGFASGATDYLRKPFSIEELIVRIKNQLKLGKNLNGSDLPTNVLIGTILFDISGYELRSGGRSVKLSNRDMEILKLLYANRNRVTARKDLLLTVWGDDTYFNSRTLDVYIRKLRKYFSADRSVQLITLKGEGYMFIVP